MTHQPKFEIGQLVYKWTGNYGGPGRVRGIANDEGQPLRYLVGHRIEGGFGEFYHVYAEGNLRESGDNNDSELPSADNVRGILGPPANSGEAPDSELVEALSEAHRQVDTLLAMVITLDRSFMPSQSPLWPEIVRRAELIRKHGASL